VRLFYDGPPVLLLWGTLTMPKTCFLRDPTIPTHRVLNTHAKAGALYDPDLSLFTKLPRRGFSETRRGYEGTGEGRSCSSSPLVLARC
jgi:hypothetical protein